MLPSELQRRGMRAEREPRVELQCQYRLWAVCALALVASTDSVVQSPIAARAAGWVAIGSVGVGRWKEGRSSESRKSRIPKTLQ